MNIQVIVKTVYGNKTIYPYCDKAKLFADIAGTLTLLPRDIERIKQLGFSVEVVTDEPKTL